VLLCKLLYSNDIHYILQYTWTLSNWQDGGLLSPAAASCLVHRESVSWKMPLVPGVMAIRYFYYCCCLVVVKLVVIVVTVVIVVLVVALETALVAVALAVVVVVVAVEAALVVVVVVVVEAT